MRGLGGDANMCDLQTHTTRTQPFIVKDENHDIAIAMSSSRADPVLPWLGVFKCLYQSHCTDWGHLNV